MPISEHLKDKICHIANLPTLPQVATRLMRVINDPRTSSQDVAFIVGQDLSLSAKILRLANSAFYGIPKSITNINNAVVILGLKVINTIVLSLTVFDMFKEDHKSVELFDRRSFWLHSLSCALISKHLASRIRKFVPFDPEEAFCAGLLHDLGKVVMEQYLHDDFHAALIDARHTNRSIVESEIALLGYTHTDVAELLTSSWGLPPEIELPMIYHHTPSDSDICTDIISLCHYADWLSYEIGMGIDKKHSAPPIDHTFIDQLNIADSDLEEMKERLPSELEKTSILFNIAGSTDN